MIEINNSLGEWMIDNGLIEADTKLKVNPQGVRVLQLRIVISLYRMSIPFIFHGKNSLNALFNQKGIKKMRFERSLFLFVLKI